MKSRIFSCIEFLGTSFFVLLVLFYRYCIKAFFVSQASCRFDPTCSQYALTTLKHNPLHKALPLILKRLSKCQPWGSYGYDPAPKELNLNERS